MARLMLLLMLFTASLMAVVPAVMVKKDGTKPSEPLGIKKLDIKVDVAGNLATTTMEITFFNDLDRILEGQFYFPLVEGAVVSRFGLDLKGKLREGVVVEKAKGQKVYEAVIRQKIDPGLLQWTKGNNFKARIYPIPAKGTKKLLIAYEQQLIKTDQGYQYNLPLDFKNKMDLFSVTVNALNQPVQPVVDHKKELINFRFKQTGQNYMAELVQEQYVPNKALSFLLPYNHQPVILVKREKRGGDYFYLNVDGKSIMPKMAAKAKKLPRQLCLIWDASRSMAKRDLDREVALIDGYLSKLKNQNIKLWILRNDLKKQKRVTRHNLKAKLKSIPYDGGTQLGALTLNKKEFKRCGEIILSTDGISNFGSSEAVFWGTPVMVINSQTTAEHSVLNYIARKSGGIYLNLDRISDKQGQKLLMEQPFQFIKATYTPKSVGDLYPSMPTPVSGDFALSGRLLQPSATITLHFGYGTKTVIKKEVIVDGVKHQTDSAMVSRIWAKMTINELDQQPKKYEGDIVKLGKKHSIVTRFTSLLVLDRLEDYVQHNIVPPKELQEAYFKIVESKKVVQKRKELAKLDNLHKRYQTMVKWWHKTFKFNKPKPKPVMKKSRISNSRGGGGSGRARAMRRRSPRLGFVASESGADMDDEGRSDSRVSLKDKKKSGAKAGATGGMTLAKWNPDTPYLKALKKVKKGHYRLYLKLSKDYQNSSAFYLDVADFFIDLKQRKLALRILSNIAEMELDNHQLLRILAHRLAQLKYYTLAIAIFEQVAQIRPEEPQSFRDLGLIYSLNNQPQKAIDYLYKVAIGTWDGRFSDIDLIALHELNGIIALNKGRVNISKIQKRLIKNLHADIRVVLNWDSDNSDMDLWVTDPNGEKCYYSHKKTFIGGWISQDFTGGYGPEAFWLKRAKPGNYRIDVNFYGSRQQTLVGATTIQIQLFLNYGRKNQKLKEITMRLKGKSAVVKAGTFRIK